MIKKALCTVLTLIMLSTIGHAQTCYNVKGDVSTVNSTPVAQTGNITLVLTDKRGDEAFNDSGILLGVIDGATYQYTILHHSTQFLDEAGNTKHYFLTSGDKAKIKDIRATDADGGICSYFVSENITTIDDGSGFFEHLKSVNIKADGYISFCPLEYANKFELKGEICVE